MDEILLKKINKYKSAGWRIEEDTYGIAIWGVGDIISPSGNCFRFDEMRFNFGWPPWEPWQDSEIKEARRFARIYRLVNEYCRSCYIGDGIENLFEKN